MATTNEVKAKDKAFGEKIKLVATIIGIVSPILALATFIGIKPEKRESLEWEYVSKSSLVNTSAASSDKIEVTFEGRKVKQLSVITARLFNSGSLPIDSSNVKDDAYPTIVFPSSINVISAEIKSRTPNGLKVEVHYNASQVRVEHGLLNPGDSVNLQILLEGDPGDITSLPNVNYRISGILNPSTRFPSPPARRVGIAYFQLSPLSEYILLITASLLPVILVMLGAFGLVQTFKQGAFPERKIADAFKRVLAAKTLPTTSVSDLKEAVAQAMYSGLSSPLDKRVRDFIKNLDVSKAQSREQWLENIPRELQERFTPTTIWGRLQALNRTEFFIGLCCFVFGVASALILTGSWYRIIVGS